MHIDGGAEHIYSLFGAIHLTLGIILLFRKKNFLSWLFLLHFLDLAYHNIYFSIYFSGGIVKWPHLYGTLYPIVPVIYLLNYLIIRILLDPEYRPSIWVKIQFFTPLIMIIQMMPLFQLTAQEKVAYYLKHQSVSIFLSIPVAYTREIIYLYAISMTAYTLYILKNKFNFNIISLKLKKNSYPKDIVLLLGLFFILFFIFMAGFQIGEYTGIFIVSFISSIMLNLGWIFFYLFVTVAPYIFKIAYPEFTNKNFTFKKYMKSRLANVNLEKVRVKLEMVCEKEKFFKKEKIKLETLAREVGISPEQLSEYLNTFLNKSFTEYINDLKIEEGKILLMEKKEVSTTRIGFEAGFGSTSAWHRAFKDATGMTPEEYRKNTISLNFTKRKKVKDNN